MKFFTAFLLVSSAGAFAPATPLTFAARKSSSIQMVADDAKVCLVTGSSRGLGKSIALELGKYGQKVVINYVSDTSKDSAEATVEEIKALGGDAMAVQADSKFQDRSRDTLFARVSSFSPLSILQALILLPLPICSSRSLTLTALATCSSTTQELPRTAWLHE